MADCAEEAGMKTSKKECFILFQKVGLTRNPFCQRCGSPAAAIHHVFPRRNLGTAFESDNGLSLCLYDHAWAHKHPAAARELLKAKIGEERYIYLEALSRETVRLRETDFKDIAVELQLKLVDILTKQ
jgi:hypothetical protein